MAVDFSAIKAVIFQRAKQKKLDEATAREQWIADIAEGKLTDADEIVKGLDRFKINAEQLEAGVARYHQRKADQKIVADKASVQKQLANAGTERAKLDAEYAEVTTRVGALQKANYELQQSLNRHLGRIGDAENRLRESVGESAKEKRAARQARVSDVRRRVQDLRSSLWADNGGTPIHYMDANGRENMTIAVRRRGVMTGIDETKRHLGPTNQNPESRKRYQSQLDSHQQALRDLDAEEKAARVELAKLEKELAAIEAQDAELSQKELVA